MNRTSCMAAAAAGALALGVPGTAKADIVYTPGPGSVAYGLGLPPVEIDFDQDGAWDLRLDGAFPTVSIDAPRVNLAVGWNGSPFILCGGTGEVVGPATEQWSLADGLFFYYHEMAGHHDAAPFGVRFINATGVHYAYVDFFISYPNDGWVMELNGWAYETTPNLPIIIGAVPTPGAGSVLVVAGVWAGSGGRRRRW